MVTKFASNKFCMIIVRIEIGIEMRQFNFPPTEVRACYTEGLRSTIE